MMFYTPLEQFEIIPIISFKMGILDFSITNEVVVLSLIFFFVSYLFIFSTKAENSSFYIIPHRWQIIIEAFFKLILSMISDNVASQRGQNFFPFVFTIFVYILMLNLIGLVPYSFTLTSHLIVTFALALFMFIGINIICVRTHGMEFFSLFLPGGTSFVLALLLVPIELISFIFRPISLSIRLFANMMAGHTLLKVIAGFAWQMMQAGTLLFVAHIVTLIVLTALIGLEMAVAFIQAYVFAVLTCIYINEAENLH